MKKENIIPHHIKTELGLLGILLELPTKEGRFFAPNCPHMFKRKLLILPFVENKEKKRKDEEIKPLLYTPEIQIMVGHGRINADGEYSFFNGVLVEEAVNRYAKIMNEYDEYTLGAVITCHRESEGDLNVHNDIQTLNHLIYPKSLARVMIPKKFVTDSNTPLIASSPAWNFP
jgi:hypothetical protein